MNAADARIPPSWSEPPVDFGLLVEEKSGHSEDSPTMEASMSGLDEHINQLLDGEVGQIMERGEDLSKFGQNLAQQLYDAESVVLDSYMQDADKFLKLLELTTTCEQVLESFEKLVHSSRQQLNTLSDEMKKLQDSTAIITTKTANRKMADKMLADVIKRIQVPDDYAQLLLTSDVNDAYVDRLRDLQNRLDFLQNDPLMEGTPMQAQLVPTLNDLCLKAVTKLNAFLHEKLTALHEPNTNLRILQQNLFVRYGLCFRFLQLHADPYATAIRQTYTEKMGQTYRTHTRKTWKMFEPRISSSAVKKDLLITKEMFGSKKPLSRDPSATIGPVVPEKVFQARLETLRSLDRVGEQLLLDPVLKISKDAVSFVDAFAHVTVQFINDVIHEGEFVSDFFMGGGGSSSSSASMHPTAETFPDASGAGPTTTVPIAKEQMVASIFEKSLQYAEEKLRRFLTDSHDWNLVLLLLRLLQALQCFCLHPSGILTLSPTVVRKRRTSLGADFAKVVDAEDQTLVEGRFWVPSFLAQWVDGTLATIRARSKHLLEGHTKSVHEAMSVLFSPFPTLNWDQPDSLSDDALESLRPHIFVFRYCSLITDAHAINHLRVPADIAHDPYVSHLTYDLSILRSEVLGLLKILAERHTQPPVRAAFLINCYSVVLQAFEEKNLPTDIEDFVIFSHELQAHIQKFVKFEYASSPFQRMQLFVESTSGKVKEVNPSEETNEQMYESNRVQINEDELRIVVNTFTSQWAEGMAQFFKKVTLSFSRKATVDSVLRMFFTRILENNMRVRDILYSCYRQPALRTKLVPNSLLKHEISTKYILTPD